MKQFFKNSAAVLFIFFFLFLAQKTEAADIFSASKIPIMVTEKAGKDLKDYQVLINLNEGNFSFGADKNKISFIDKENAKLNYWIEDWNTESKEAKIWVKIPEIKAGEIKTIYMDLNGDDLPSGDETFDFFDDFDKFDANKWNGWYCNRPGFFAVSGSVLSLNETEKNCGGYRSTIIWSDKIFSPDTAFRARIKHNIISGAGSDHHFGFGKLSPEGAWVAWAMISVNESDQGHPKKPKVSAFNSGKSKSVLYDYETDNAFRVWDGFWTKNSLAGYVDGKFMGAVAENLPKEGLHPLLSNAKPNHGEGETFVDWFFVRQYAFPEPEAVLGEDISIDESFLAVSKQGDNRYLVEGKIFSTFKENLENIAVAVYDKNPQDNASRELTKITLGKIEPKKDTDFKIAVAVDGDKISELYVFVDPANKIAESNKANNIAKKKISADIAEAVSPFLASFIIFLSLFILIAVLFYSYRNFKNNSEGKNPSLQTKACLNCGMVLDKNQSKCPVCGMGAFK